MPGNLTPHDLTWSEVNPASHPFDRASALTAVRTLGPADRVPARPDDSADIWVVIAWSQNEGQAWANAMTRSLVERYGRWSLGWRWAPDEGDIGGGPVGSWCCPRHSITTPDATLTRVTKALGAWRSWLEDLAELFDRHRLDLPSVEDRRHAWERATASLVNHVVERTEAGDAWYEHCAQVLTWYLTRWGVDEQAAREQVEQAVAGRFESWTRPEHVVVEEVARHLAAPLQHEGET